MVELTRLNGQKLVVNADLVEFIEATPDTVITLATGRKLIVAEPVEQVIKLVIAYRRRVASGAPIEKGGSRWISEPGSVPSPE